MEQMLKYTKETGILHESVSAYIEKYKENQLKVYTSTGKVIDYKKLEPYYKEHNKCYITHPHMQDPIEYPIVILNIEYLIRYQTKF
jgi:hypothetical protein